MSSTYRADRKEVSKWFEACGSQLSLDMYQNGVELGTWLPTWLDHLTFLITGRTVTSVSKRDAMKVLKPAFEQFMKKKFPEVQNENPMFGSYKEVVPNNIIGDNGMNTQEVTGTKKVSLTKKKVSAAKTSKPAKEKAAKADKAEKRGRAGKFADTAKIVVLTKDNPKREGTKAHENFALYSKNKNVGAFLAAGGSRADLAWDVKAGFIEIKE